MTATRTLVLAVLIVLAGVLAAVATISAQPKPQWASKDCFTLDDVAAFLSTLPADRAADAKVVVINSQRSFLGSMSNPYYVFYRK